MEHMFVYQFAELFSYTMCNYVCCFGFGPILTFQYSVFPLIPCLLLVTISKGIICTLSCITANFDFLLLLYSLYYLHC
jgi:hypothetical protein